MVWDIVFLGSNKAIQKTTGNHTIQKCSLRPNRWQQVPGPGKGFVYRQVPALVEHILNEAKEIINNYILCQVVFQVRKINRDKREDAILTGPLKEVSSDKTIF